MSNYDNDDGNNKIKSIGFNKQNINSECSSHFLIYFALNAQSLDQNGNAIIALISKIVVLSITIGATSISLEILMQILKEGWEYLKYSQDHLLLGII